jgi:lipoyl(octanoyl) transferase
MAVDEWLLKTSQIPVLRVYSWEGAWGSLGYFGKLAEAQAAFSGLNWVRRWTGGGVVDHRADWTYTLVIPRGEALADARGAESYRQIHMALAEALRGEGREARLAGGEEKTGQAACFENPVDHDLIGITGKKIAGAGQRRSRLGLLHQGSVATPSSSFEDSTERAKAFASELCSGGVETFLNSSIEPHSIKNMKTRYSLAEWTERR